MPAPFRQIFALLHRCAGRVVFSSLAALFFNSGCVATPKPAATSERDLRAALIALGPAVSREEATRVAARAHAAAGELAREYRAVTSPHLQNILVNTGLRPRGLCFHWTEDMRRRLEALRLTTLDLHWGEARAGTLREHNCVVITARGQPFADGIVLDAWRHAGRLHWSPVRADHYPWRENHDYYRGR